MKKRRILCSVLAALFVLSAFAGCKEKTEKTPSQTSENPNVAKEDKAEISFIRPAHDANKEDDPYNQAMKRYKEKYGADVVIETAGYDTWMAKVITAAASETPIDVIYGTTAEYPMFAAKKYTQPLEQFVNLESEYVNQGATKDYFTYQGKVYLCPTSDIATCVLYYNKDMIENAGFDDPYELYKQGKWDFATLQSMCKEMSKDLNGDGNNDVWGLSMWYGNTFLGANCTSLCKIDENGKYSLNFDDPALMNSLNILRDAYSSPKWVGLEGADIFQSFYNGKDAFVQEYNYSEAEEIVPAKEKGDFDFEYGVVPMAYGPDNKEKRNIGNAGGLAIASGCKNPYHAGEFINLAMEENKIYGDKQNAKVPAEHVALYQELAKNVFSSQQRDSAVDGGQTVLGLISGGKGIQQTLDSFKDKYQAMLDEANGVEEE